MNGKIRSKDYFFIAYFVPFLIALFLEDVAIEYNLLSVVIKAIKLTVMLMLIVALLKKQWKKKNFVAMFCGVLFGGCIVFLTEDFFWFIAILMGFVSYGIDKKLIYKTLICTIFPLIIVTVVLCLIGVLPNYLTYRTSSSIKGRYSLGFVHSACLPLSVLYLMFFYVLLKGKKTESWVLISFVVLEIILFVICQSRNAFLAAMLLFVSVLYLKKFKICSVCRRVITFLSNNMVLFSVLFSILPGYLRFRNMFMELWYVFDDVFTGRSLLASSAFAAFGVPIVNLMNYTEYFNTTVYINGIPSNGIVLDSAYLYLLIRYGIVVLLFCMCVLNSYKKEKGNGLIEQSVFVLIVLVNIIDNDVLSYGCLPILIIGIRNLQFKKRIESNRK